MSPMGPMSFDRHDPLCTCTTCLDEAFPHLGDHREEIDAVTLDSGVPMVSPDSMCDVCGGDGREYPAVCPACSGSYGADDDYDGPSDDTLLDRAMPPAPPMQYLDKDSLGRGGLS